MPPQTEKKGSAAAAPSNPPAVEPVAELSPVVIQVDDKIYDAKSLAETHPGGELFVKAFSGRDATEAFLSYHRRRFPHDKVKDALIKVATPLKDSAMDAEYLELCDLVEKVLPRNKAFAPVAYYMKVAGLLSMTVGLEFYIHYTQSYVWYLTGLQGLFFAWVGMNIQHDANHGAVSRNHLVNRALGMTQNWIGGSALDWIHQHVVQHHIFPNNVNHDPDIVGNDFLRLNPLKPRESYHVGQCLYIFLLLGLFGISHIFYSLKHNIDGFHFTRMSKLVNSYRLFEELTIFFFFARWLVYPLIQVPALSTLLNILPMFIVGGYYLAFFFVISHNFEGALLYNNEKEQEVHESFLRKQVATASNVGGRVLCFFNGGLNYQIEHHLFPRIQHNHYPTIAPVVREFCQKNKIPYRHFPTVWDNVQSCIRHLYQLGTQQNPSGYHPVPQ